MLPYISHRSLQAVPVLVGISVLSFLMLHLVPGDPVQIFAGDKPLTPERAVELRHQYGLDRPLVVQYVDYASHAVRGDLGVGLRSQRPVLDSILQALPGTAQLTLAALTMAALIGITLGILAAVAHGTWLDTAVMAVAMLGISTPVFYSSMLEVLRQEYVVTARAKGLAPAMVVVRHALKNALIPAVTMLGLQLGALLGGAVVTETIFSRPGVGRLAVDAILSRDFPLVQGTVLFTAVAYVLVNLAVDVSYAVLDPRIRYR